MALVVLSFLGYINLKRWCNFAPLPGLYEILRLSNTCAAGVQHKNIDWSLWEGNFKHMLQCCSFL